MLRRIQGHHRLSGSDQSVELYGRDDIGPMLTFQRHVINHVRAGFRPLQPLARGTSVPLPDFQVQLPAPLPSAAAGAPSVPRAAFLPLPVPPPAFFVRLGLQPLRFLRRLSRLMHSQLTSLHYRRLRRLVLTPLLPYLQPDLTLQSLIRSILQSRWETCCIRACPVRLLTCTSITIAAMWCMPLRPLPLNSCALWGLSFRVVLSISSLPVVPSPCTSTLPLSVRTSRTVRSPVCAALAFGFCAADPLFYLAWTSLCAYRKLARLPQLLVTRLVELRRVAC